VSDPPAGTTARPLEPGDLDAVVELERASQEHDGLEGLDRSDIEAGWRRPDFRLAAMSVGVFDGDLLAGYAEVFNGRAEASVRPGDRGRGIGTWLARATWSLARELGWRSVGQTVPETATDATAMLRTLGYRVGHTSWLLGIDLDREPGTPDLPDGCTFHGFAPERDERALFDVIDPAFDEWPGRVSEGFENWREVILRRPQVRPELVVVIAHGDRPVGAAIGFDYGDEQDGLIQQLAVERTWRGRGLGRALLQESFRRFWNAGRRTVGLSTDSRTGALGLYLYVGMDVRATYIRMTKELSPEAPPA
jgi:ribosomal protein S18 acetylase RimI-like enzyme